MPNPDASSPADPQVLTLFQEELARAAALPGLVAPGPALWPRFAGYYQGLTRLPRRQRRALQRRWRRSLGGLALLCALGQAPALAATIGVDGTTCTLIDAITAANSDAPTGGCTAGSEADILNLVAGSTHTLTVVNNSTYGDTGLPVISSAITIEGNGSALIRDPSAPAFRIFAVNGTGDLALNATTVSGGALNLFTFVSNGGGIFVVSGGRLSITNSTVAGNRADYGGGVGNVGIVTLTNSTVSGNTARFGGGMGNYIGTVTLTNSTVSGNTASFGGGGGVQNVGGTATLTNSTVSGNSAVGSGGGVINYGDATATLTNSTVSGNSAGSGGGMFNDGTLTLARSLVAGNTAATAHEIEIRGSGTVTTDGFNLFGHSGLTNAQAFSGFAPGATDLVATSDGDDVPTALGAILDTTLVNKGGLTQTHSLILGSPAIDAVLKGCPPPATDQRGESRPQGTHCDIGAFERSVASADLAVSVTDSPDPLTVNQTLTYTITVRNNSLSAATGVQLTDSLPPGVVLSFKPSGCTGTMTVTCNLGTLASAAVATVTITVIPTVPGTVENKVTVVAIEQPLNPADDSDTETTTVEPPFLPQADLAITAAAGPDPGASGQALTYTLVVRNDGPEAATGVQVTDDLPPGVGLGQITPSQGTCGGTDPVVCDLGALPSGVQATVAIVVIPTNAKMGTLTNQATVNGNQSEPNPGNNSATTTTTVQPPLEPPTGKTACTTVRCQLLLTCNLSEFLGRNCDNRVTLFVRAASARRVAGALTKAKKQMIKFAAGVTNVPPNETEKVRFDLTPKGRKVASTLIQQGRKKLRGKMEITNAVGGIDTIPLTVRLK